MTSYSLEVLLAAILGGGRREAKLVHARLDFPRPIQHNGSSFRWLRISLWRQCAKMFRNWGDQGLQRILLAYSSNRWSCDKNKTMYPYFSKETYKVSVWMWYCIVRSCNCFSLLFSASRYFRVFPKTTERHPKDCRSLPNIIQSFQRFKEVIWLFWGVMKVTWDNSLTFVVLTEDLPRGIPWIQDL